MQHVKYAMPKAAQHTFTKPLYKIAGLENYGSPREGLFMYANQARCFHCAHYSVVDDTCTSVDSAGRDRCMFERAVYNRTRVRHRRSKSDAFRDLCGNHVDNCGDGKLLKPRKLRTFTKLLTVGEKQNEL